MPLLLRYGTVHIQKICIRDSKYIFEIIKLFRRHQKLNIFVRTVCRENDNFPNAKMSKNKNM